MEQQLEEKILHLSIVHIECNVSESANIHTFDKNKNTIELPVCASAVSDCSGAFFSCSKWQRCLHVTAIIAAPKGQVPLSSF